MRRLKISKIHTFMVGIMMMALLLCCSTQVQAAQSKDYSYTVTDGKATITKYKGVEGAEGVVTIPKTLAGFPVTSIGPSAFKDFTGLKTIHFPQGVTSIGNKAFFGCTGLTYISPPQGVTSIGDSAFYGCTSLIGVIIPQKVISIPSNAFSGCTGLKTIIIPKGVTSIGFGAFEGCKGLTSIRFNSEITVIGDAIYTIPATTKIIGYDPSTAKTYATKYNRKFEVIDANGTGVSLKVISSSEIDLSWKAVKGAKSYTIYQATSENGTYTKVGSVKTASFKNTKLQPSTSYWYKVTAITADGESGFSDIKTATTLTLTPSGVKAKAVSSTAVTVTWQAIVGSTFNVYRSTSKEVGYTKVEEGLNVAVYTDMNLRPKKTYWYIVTALDSNENESIASTPVKAFTKVR